MSGRSRPVPCWVHLQSCSLKALVLFLFLWSLWHHQLSSIVGVFELSYRPSEGPLFLTWLEKMWYNDVDASFLPVCVSGGVENSVVVYSLLTVSVHEVAFYHVLVITIRYHLKLDLSKFILWKQLWNRTLSYLLAAQFLLYLISTFKFDIWLWF